MTVSKPAKRRPLSARLAMRLRGLRTAAGHGLAAVRRLALAERRRRARVAQTRDELLARLRVLSAAAPVRRPQGRVLVDGLWDNPNYWLRYGLLRSALGLAADEEIGLTGFFRTAEVTHSFALLGISDTVSFAERLRRVKSEARASAQRLLRDTRGPDDVMAWRLPDDFPNDIVYDGLLKRQRGACVDVHHPEIEAHVTEALACVQAADQLIGEIAPRRIVLSHAVNFACGALAWAALRRGIPTVVLFGNYGLPRFFKLQTAADLHDWNDGLAKEEIVSLTEARAAALERIGAEYVKRRLAGATDDLGARSAFVTASKFIDRKGLANAFGWTGNRPVVTVYASNWFDFPHACGLTNFRDFLDWLRVTVDRAVAIEDVYWLFKPHPCDEWYGGVTLADLMPAHGASHIALAAPEWNGADVFAASDALVTTHSTGGVEFAASGKPVLLADRGWYDRAGLAVVASSREHYAELLGEAWWTRIDRETAARRARIFAGAYFCAPDWPSILITDDDSRQDALYEPLLAMLRSLDGWERECDTLRRWAESPTSRYHLFKMLEADGYALSNVLGRRETHANGLPALGGDVPALEGSTGS